MDVYRVSEAAELLGVSDDTVRRWIDSGRLTARRDEGRTLIDGPELAAYAAASAASAAEHTPDPRASSVSARNRLPGIVTRVLTDRVMAQVEITCGPYRIVSLMSSEAVADLGLEPGARAVVSVKSTNVVVERP